MGASISTTVSDTTNDIMSEVITNIKFTNKTECNNLINSLNLFSIDNNNFEGNVKISGITLSNKVLSDSMCSQDTTNTSESLMDNLIHTIDKKQSSTSMGLGINTSTIISSLKNSVKTSTITNQEIQNLLNCATNLTSENRATIVNNNFKDTVEIKDIVLENYTESVNKCYNNSQNISKAVSKASTIAESAIENTAGVGILGTLMVGIGFIVFIGLAAGIAKQGMNSNNNNEGMSNLLSSKMDKDPRIYMAKKGAKAALICFAILFFLIFIGGIIFLIYSYFVQGMVNPYFSSNTYKWKFDDNSSNPYPKCYLMNNGKSVDTNYYAVFNDDGTRYKCVNTNIIKNLTCSTDNNYKDCTTENQTCGSNNNGKCTMTFNTDSTLYNNITSDNVAQCQGSCGMSTGDGIDKYSFSNK